MPIRASSWLGQCHRLPFTKTKLQWQSTVGYKSQAHKA